MEEMYIRQTISTIIKLKEKDIENFKEWYKLDNGKEPQKEELYEYIEQYFKSIQGNELFSGNDYEIALQTAAYTQYL